MMLLTTQIPLALVGLFHCHGSAAQYSNSSSAYFQEVHQEHGVLLGVLSASAPSFNPYLSTVQSSNIASLSSDNCESFSTHYAVQSSEFTSHAAGYADTSSTSFASTASPKYEDRTGKQATNSKSSHTSSVEEKVDFDQWINTNMLEEDDVPFPIMPWDQPDYGPSHKNGKEKVVSEEHDYRNSSWPLSKLPGYSLLGSNSNADEDVYMSYDHSTDSDDDGGLAPCLREDIYGKAPWNEAFESEGYHYAGTSTENNTYRWLLSPAALNKTFKAGEGSSSEDSFKFNSEHISVRNLVLGATGFTAALSKDRQKKRKRKAIGEDLLDEDEMLSSPETRTISQEQLINKVKGIYAGLSIVESKCFGVEARDEYSACEYQVRTPDLDTNAAGLPDEVMHIEDRWVKHMRRNRVAEEERKEHQTWSEVKQNWSENPGDLLSKGRLSNHLGITSLNIKLAQEMSSFPTNTFSHDPWEGSSKQYLAKTTPSFSKSQNTPSSLTSSPASTTSPPTTTSPSITPSPPPNPSLNTNKHKCPTCTSSFSRAFELRKHFKYHSKPLSCPTANCPQRFANQRDLKRHQKAIHKDICGVDKWFCEVKGCKFKEVGFGRKDNLLRHLRNLHGGKGVK